MIRTCYSVEERKKQNSAVLTYSSEIEENRYIFTFACIRVKKRWMAENSENGLLGEQEGWSELVMMLTPLCISLLEF